MIKKILTIVGYIFAGVLFAFGLLVFTYPLLNGYTVEKNTEAALNDFHNLKNVSSGKDISDLQSESNGMEGNVTNSYDFEKLYEEMQKYNENIFQNGQSGLNDAWSYEQSSIDLSMYGIYDSLVAEIRIPKMEVDLPIYLGATWNNMGKGVAQLGQTSMPIGGTNTNCVLAGHRGSSGGKFFLDIELLEIGDEVYIDNLWETLNYRVKKIDIIDPGDIDRILIQEGKDMVTLVTCHPYPYNNQRYVVYCERIQDDVWADNSDTRANNIASESDSMTKNKGNSQYFMAFENVLYILVTTFLIVLTLVLFRKNRK